MGTFKIDADDLQWLSDPVNDPEDHCLHGHAVAIIGERKLEYTCTVSATALYLLKTLTEDHIIDQDNQMMPCCGHFLVANDDLTNVTIVGCAYGIDWSVIHEGDSVKLILEDGYEQTVPLDEYRKEVCRFADKIEAYYNACPPRSVHSDEFHRNGYTAFWNEWHRRYRQAQIVKDAFTVQKIAENIWAIEQRGVRAFLLVGLDSAVLVDTCFSGDIKSVCESITDQPITLITTHSDPDHTGCDHQFPIQYLHRAEFARYEKRGSGAVKAVPVEEGTVFTVGEFQLEVVLIPGHTPGSIALLDRKHRFLISGDTVQSHCIFMHGDGRDLSAFRNSIEKLEKMRQEGLFDTVYPSHGEAVVPADILIDHVALAEDVLNGEAVPAGPAPDWFPDSVKTYRHGRAQMYY